ncbi:MAG: OB-fold protein [Cytophagaceae bacterium]
MKKVLWVLLIMVLAGIAFAMYVFYKPHRNIVHEDAGFKLGANELYLKYQEDETAANEKYLDKVVQVAGRIDEITTDQKGNMVLVLKKEGEMFGVSCTLDESSRKYATDLKAGDKIMLKGIVTGGGTMMDVVMVQCHIVR